MMCGRFAVTTDPALLAIELDAINEVDPGSELFAPTPRFNVAPSTDVLAVVARHPREEPEANPIRRVRGMRWGLVPSWAPSVTGSRPLFNARAETLATKPMFAKSFQSKRCLIPMDGWYEWQRQGATNTGAAHTGAGNTGTAKKGTAKVPYYFTPRDRTRFFVAGLWAARLEDPTRRDDPDAWLFSCTVITTEAVGALAAVHDRMPLVLPASRFDSWLDPDVPGRPEWVVPIREELAAQIEVREVSSLVNNVRNDGPELIAAATSTRSGPEQPPTLF